MCSADEILLTMRRNSGVDGKRAIAAGASAGGRPSNAHRDPFLTAIAEEKVRAPCRLNHVYNCDVATFSLEIVTDNTY